MDRAQDVVEGIGGKQRERLVCGLGQVVGLDARQHPQLRVGGGRRPRRRDVVVEAARVRAAAVVCVAGRGEVVREADLGQTELQSPFDAGAQLVVAVRETAVDVVVGDR